MENNDFYKVLGISPGADQKEVKNAYRNLALKYHPDRNQDDAEAAEKMKAVNEAYAVLSDPQKRGKYDQFRNQFGSSAYQRFKQSHSDQDIFSGSDINTILEELAKNFGVRGFDELFKDIYGQGYRTFEFKNPRFSGRGFMFSGPFGTGAQRMRQGQGRRNLSKSETVLNKLGRYAIKKLSGLDLPENGPDTHDVIYVTPEQIRGGGPYAYFHRKKGKKIIVKIPPNIKAGQRIRLKGMGDEGHNGGQTGDLFLKVKEKKSMINRVKDFVKDLTG